MAGRNSLPYFERARFYCVTAAVGMCDPSMIIPGYVQPAPHRITLTCDWVLVPGPTVSHLAMVRESVRHAVANVL